MYCVINSLHVEIIYTFQFGNVEISQCLAGHNWLQLHNQVVRFGFWKASVEFKKQLDPDLPFYYHTSSHSHFYEGPLPDFSMSSPKKKWNFRTAPHEQLAAFASWCATMPVQGSLSVRPQFNNLPLELPPIPTDQIHVVEHSYV